VVQWFPRDKGGDEGVFSIWLAGVWECGRGMSF